MSVATFIPIIWSARLLENLEKMHVATNFINSDYEGEISSQGAKLKINSIGEISIVDYTKNTDLDDPEELSTTDQELIIDQAKAFNFQVDDIDQVQMKASLIDNAMKKAAYGLSDKADQFIFTTIANAAPSANTLGNATTPIELTKDNIYENVVKLKTILDKKNVPSLGRKLALPPDAEGLLLLDDRFVKTGGTNAEGRLVNGQVAKAAGFDIFISNNLPVTAGKYSILATVPTATTYAEQILSTEAYRMEKRFADAVKGLHVYGAKNTTADAVAKIIATFPA